MDDIRWYDLSLYAPVTIIRKYPHLPWDRRAMSRNSSITLDDTLYLYLPEATGAWEYDWLTITIPIHEQMEYPNLDWAWHDRWEGAELLAMNSTVTPAIAREYGLTVDWGAASADIDMELVRKNPHLSWYPRYLAMNSGITMDDVLYLDMNGIVPLDTWDWGLLSRYLPMWQIRKYPHLPYRRGSLSMNPGLQVDDMYYDTFTDATGDWNMDMVASHMGMEEIVANIDKGPGYPIFDRGWLSDNPDITMEYIRLLSQPHSNITGYWNWYALSKHIPIDEVLDNLDRPWVREGLSHNESITISAMEDIDDYAIEWGSRIDGDWYWDDIYMYADTEDVLRYYGVVQDD